MTFDIILKGFAAPVFFFLSLVLTVFVGISVYFAFVANSGYIVLGGLLFVLGWNAGRMGLLVMGMIEAGPKPPVLTGAPAIPADGESP